MRPNRLRQVSHLLPVLLAVFTFGAIATSAAQAATEGPFWTVEGKKLNKNETREIIAKAYEGTKNPIKLEAELLGVKAKLECHLAKVAPGGFFAGGVPGTGEFFAELSDCTTTNVGSGCKVVEPIRTEKVRGEIVVSDENGHFGKNILGEFDPATGTEGKFVELRFEGSSCIVKTTEVGKGLVVGSAYRDPPKEGETPESVLTKGTPEGKSFLIKSPDEFTENGGTKSVWLFKNNVFEILNVTPFKAFGNEAKLIGTVLYSLARNGVPTGENYGQEV
jgi:hypothetical protein